MICHDSSRYPEVTIHFKSSNWTKEDYKQFASAINTLIHHACTHKDHIKLFIRGGVEPGASNPPFTFWVWVVKDIIAWSKFIPHCIEKTAIYRPDSGMNGFFDYLFKFYTPKRPLEMFDDYHKAKAWLAK